MNSKFIIADLSSSIRQWLRSKGTVFWTLMFPILLILIFGAIFSGVDDVEIPIVVQNLDIDDETGFTKGFIDNLSRVSALDIEPLEKNIDINEYMHDEDISGGLIIPDSFGKNVMDYLINQQNPAYPFDESDLPFNLTLIFDPSDQSTVSILRSIIVGIIYESNIQITGGEKVPNLKDNFTARIFSNFLQLLNETASRQHPFSKQYFLKHSW